MKSEKKDKIAVFRFGVIFPLLENDVSEMWGEKERILRVQVSKDWNIPYSNKSYMSKATILNWYKKYIDGGKRIEALYPSDRGDKGKNRTLDEETTNALILFRKENPKISVTRLLEKAKSQKIIPPGNKVSLESVYRILRSHKLDTKKKKEDMRKFEVQMSNDLWQSDCMHGPKILHEGKMCKTYLFAIIDDHSRLIPHGQFYFKENVENYLDCFWTAMKKRGVPRKLYVDNGPREHGSNYFEMVIDLNFLRNNYNIEDLHYLTGKAKIQVRAINMLAEYQIHGYALSKMRSKPQDFTLIVKSLFNMYLLKRSSDGRCEKTLKSDRIYLNRFSDYIDSTKIDFIADLNTTHIHGYINTMAGLTKSSIYCGLSSLRTLLRFLYNQGSIKVDLSATVPHLKLDKTATIPSAYNKTEIEDLLKSIDRGSPKGRRDYAIIILSCRLGMRAGEICNMKFIDIYWEKNELKFNQSKTKKCIILPLLPEVGNAIIEYLKYGRPISEDEHIFLRHICPISQLCEPTLHSIVSFYLRRAGVAIPKGKKHGPHSLRHSLASILLEKNVPIFVISEILGHEDSKTTSIYLKIDISHLKLCSLDVPDLILKGGSNAIN